MCGIYYSGEELVTAAEKQNNQFCKTCLQLEHEGKTRQTFSFLVLFKAQGT